MSFNLKDERILELCDISYDGDLETMLDVYESNLNTAIKLKKTMSIPIFEEAIEQIERLIDESYDSEDTDQDFGQEMFDARCKKEEKFDPNFGGQ